LLRESLGKDLKDLADSYGSYIPVGGPLAKHALNHSISAFLLIYDFSFLFSLSIAILGDICFSSMIKLPDL
jgi:hypothetical protein